MLPDSDDQAYLAAFVNLMAFFPERDALKLEFLRPDQAYIDNLGHLVTFHATKEREYRNLTCLNFNKPKGSVYIREALIHSTRAPVLLELKKDYEEAVVSDKKHFQEWEELAWSVALKMIYLVEDEDRAGDRAELLERLEKDISELTELKDEKLGAVKRLDTKFREKVRESEEMREKDLLAQVNGMDN
ncbi:hypothetical protein BU16DRAFT_268948 [Lophium mytilinum]|uniref:Uncharacterized protein n=1 Tax=Lophium mytilinum TaxID=390894 RepID=A0A6A6R6M4_9PEZI|nr:hypothetical protein BU16DRAFT_268948 [Lophium mytilinum]